MLIRHLRLWLLSAILVVSFCSKGFCQTAEQQAAAMRQEAQQILAMEAETRDLVRLVQLDLHLSDYPDESSVAVCRDILRALAMSQEPNAQEHVRAVYESEPERRGMAAFAISQATTQRPSDLQDWRFMVRSLTVVEGEDAVSVFTALQRFRPRANKAHWVRQVILTGLTLPPDQQSAAVGLLRHWTDVPKKSVTDASWTIADYQKWFAAEYPNEPAAVLPADSGKNKWTMAKLLPEIRAVYADPELFDAGREAFVKAGCQKCHRRGQLGEALGPDMTSLGWRRQKKEILRAIIFPSQDLNEEYPAVSVVLKDGRTLTGMMSGGSEDTLTIVSNMGVRQEFPRSDVTEIVNQKISNMPEGTLEVLSLGEIRALFAFLTSIEGVPKPHGDEVQ